MSQSSSSQSSSQSLARSSRNSTRDHRRRTRGALLRLGARIARRSRVNRRRMLGRPRLEPDAADLSMGRVDRVSPADEIAELLEQSRL
jgi:hypothetical protein